MIEVTVYYLTEIIIVSITLSFDEYLEYFEVTWY